VPYRNPMYPQFGFTDDVIGGRGWSRTTGIIHVKDALYQLSYPP
jgi:hypothetical protein